MTAFLPSACPRVSHGVWVLGVSGPDSAALCTRTQASIGRISKQDAGRGRHRPGSISHTSPAALRPSLLGTLTVPGVPLSGCFVLSPPGGPPLPTACPARACHWPCCSPPSTSPNPKSLVYHLLGSPKVGSAGNCPEPGPPGPQLVAVSPGLEEHLLRTCSVNAGVNERT